MTSRWISPAAWALAIACVVGLRGIFLGSTAVDLPHHVALTALLHDNWRLDGPLASALSTMANYPVGAHLLAAVITPLVGTPLQAVNVVSWLAVLVAYGCLFRLAGRLGPAVPLVTAAALLAFAGWLGVIAPFVGFEIVISYFYAQLVADAGYALALLALAAWGRPGSDSTLVGVAAGCALLLTFHIVAALHLAAAAALWQVIAWAWGWIGFRRAAVRLLVLAGLLATVAALSPEFAAMLRFYKQAGAGTIFYPLRDPLPMAMGIAAAVIVAMLLGVFLVRRRAPTEDARTRTLALLLAAASGAALLLFAQYATLLLDLGIGTYSTLKHLYLVATMGLVGLVALLAWLARPAVPVAGGWWQAGSLRSLVSVGLAGAMVLTLPASLDDLRPSAAAYLQARDLRLHALPPDGLGTTIVVDPALPPTINYGIALTEFLLPRAGIAKQLYLGHAVAPGPEARYAMLPMSSVDASARDCLLPGGSPTGYSLVDYPCFSRTRGVARLGQPVGFGVGQGGEGFRRDGWSVTEPQGTWTLGERAILALQRPTGATDGQALRLELDLVPFIAGAMTAQSLQLRLDGVVLADWRFTEAKRQVVTASLPAGSFQGPPVLELELLIGDPRSPMDLGLSADRRRLGVMLLSLTLWSG